MRELGEGMKRIFSLMQEQELAKPELYSNGLWFRVTLLNKTVFNQKEIDWLKNFEHFNLTKSQKNIVLLGYGNKEISPNDIFKALNIPNSETEKFTQEVTVLRKLGILESFRTNLEAKNLAYRTKKDKKDITRYKVVIPMPSPFS